MKCLFRHQDFLNAGRKLYQILVISTHLKLLVVVARPKKGDTLNKLT